MEASRSASQMNCGQTEGICLTFYFLLEKQENGVDTYHRVFKLIITSASAKYERVMLNATLGPN